MWERDKSRIIERYNARIAASGASFAALNSGTEDRRELRFRILTEVGITSGSSVLDLGCGLGDFSGFLDGHGIDVDYTGYDINPQLVEEARARYPGRTFEVRDILQQPFPDFDYIVSTSCFNLRMTEMDNYVFAEEILRRCHGHARSGVSIDFLTSYVDATSAEGFHYEPERIFAVAKRLTKRVCLRHDYPLFEFNIYLYPDFKGWGT